VESALTIAQQMQNLPFSNAFLAGTEGPRTMPTCTCCAMQASYALLMQLYRLQVSSQAPLVLAGGTTYNTERLVEELHHGLEGIIRVMRDFAGSFEAIDGMRGW
jgi:hypothetical protein